jgi:hypothetical protein
MKKKIKIKSGGKVVLTLIILLISTFVYTKVGILGDLAQSHKGYLIVCIGAWFWLLVGQLLALSVIWEW